MTSNPQETNTLPVGVLEEMAEAVWMAKGHKLSNEAAMQAAWEASPGPALVQALRELYAEDGNAILGMALAEAALSLLTPDEQP